MRDVPQSRWTFLLSSVARSDAMAAFGWLLFVCATLAFWTQLQPFRSLQDYNAVQDATQSNDLRKYSTLAFSALFILFLWADGKGQRIFDIARSPIIVATLAWAAFTSLISADPSLALNRLVLAAITIQVAYAVPLLFRTVDGMIEALGLSATLIIVASYLGVLLVPDLATHTLRDVTEQTLAGNWRGIFGHKNDLSAMAALFIFLGILIARTHSRIWGIAIAVSSAILLIESEGKTSILLTVPAFFGGILIVDLRSRILSAMIGYGLIALMVIATVGGVISQPLGALLSAVLPDPTFTGRTDAWRMAVAAITGSPWLGYGYQIFWDLGMASRFASAGDMPTTFSHAHNGFLDAVLSGGFVALLLVVIWTIVLPFRHIRNIRVHIRNRTEYAFVAFLANVWLFGLMNASLEAIVFNRSNPIWYTVLIAIGCLHAWSHVLGERE